MPYDGGMAILRFAMILTLALAGCSDGGNKGGYPDADPAARVCTGEIYDNCAGDDQCDSGMCKLFSGEFQVCTQACTPGDNTTCPPGTGKCNNKGLCKPTLNNDCRPAD